MKNWARKNRTWEVEYAMSLYTSWIINENGTEFTRVFVEGSTETENLGKKVNPELSNGIDGWRRFATIHNRVVVPCKSMS